MSKVFIDGRTLTYEDVVAVARGYKSVDIASEVRDQVERTRRVLEDILAQDRVIYGVNTGFGHLASVRISDEELCKLQENLIISHAAGTGDPFPDEVVRAMILLRANSLARGLSGVRYELIEALVSLANHDICPIIPEQGSLGASGDLAPLAHLALALLGKGKVRMGGMLMDAALALERAGISPLTLMPKEGIGLINGTQAMTAVGAIALYDAVVLAITADAAASMSIEALRGIPDAFRPCLHQARPHQGQMECAEFISRLLEGSRLVSAPGELRVQDAYSIRCIPQVHGATRDVLEYVRKVINTEINSVSDNPLVFPDGQVISAGNFHGQPVALAMDFLSIATAELGNISERRIERLLNPALSGLPPFLAVQGGINSGFMISQYTAASLVSENKVLSAPASTDSIPVSASQEDHVSMGTIAARKARAVVKNVARILAIELMCACQALEFQGPEKLAPGTRRIYDLVRQVLPSLEEDRWLHPDIEAVTELVAEGRIAEVAVAAG
ncbi:MAG: histidine ammonia-lyase [Bacillota bacterium]|nr:histidine ammonia-lyase [Bacillota bacterium]HOB89213.1 histidine ammonia-lyase [Bacillota bacterium]HOJ58442.1 histidine ammonia-lyase [Bacillota bacterium]HOL02759.1 histidine ammonia-lyase [Bacillota bacterium]HPZ92891.1 histidine ammonia-lyase [Bacillota bacterium]